MWRSGIVTWNLSTKWKSIILLAMALEFPLPPSELVWMPSSELVSTSRAKIEVFSGSTNVRWWTWMIFSWMRIDAVARDVNEQCPPSTSQAAQNIDGWWKTLCICNTSSQEGPSNFFILNFCHVEIQQEFINMIQCWACLK